MIKTLRKDLLLILAVGAVFLSLSYAIGFVTDRSPKMAEVTDSFSQRRTRTQTPAHHG